jgi:hypothetical protein
MRTALALVCLAVLMARSPAADFYVSTAGRDDGSGTRAAPGDGDGPFATVQRARAAVRARRAELLARGRPVIVEIRGGTYELAETLVFGPEDSGSVTAPVVYRAAAGESVVLSGGRCIGSWTEVRPGRWQASVAGLVQGEAALSQLFVNGQRRLRPTVPRDGYFFIAAACGGSSPGRQDRFGFALGQIDAGWTNLNDVEFVAFHKWSTSRLPLQAVDPGKRIVTLAGSTWHPEHAELSTDVWYRLENVAEALDEPGEWYWDRPAATLTYLTRPGEEPNRDTVVAPVLGRLIEFRGDIEKGTFVEHIRIEGITLAYSHWSVPKSGHSVYQAEADMDGAVTGRNARACVLERCVIRHTGNAAVDWGAGCDGCQVVSCELLDLGGGGVKIGTGRFDDEPDVRQWAANCIVRDCLVAHGGRLHPAAPGLWIGHAHHNTLEHNLVQDFYYSAVSVGWRWSQGPSPSTHNTVAWNHLHTIGQGVMSDLGGIYTLGESPGTTLHHNLIHDVSRARYGGWGIYHDESSADIVTESNLVYRTEDAPFHLHHGRRLTVRNNIFAFGTNEQMKLSRPDKSGTLLLEGNIWLWRDAPLYAGGLRDEYTFRRNLYWRTDGKPVLFPGDVTLEKWREREAGCVVADPGFADAVAGNFALAAASPAVQAGFVPLDLGGAGRTTPTALPASLPAVPRTFPPAPPEPPPVIRQDFELLAVGQSGIPGWGQLAASREESALVTAETAASGTHCLKVTDGPGGALYFPHLYRELICATGVVQASLDLRLEAGAAMQFEWRDKTPWYAAGPGFDVTADGTLKSAGRELLKLPVGQWVRLVLTCGLGPQRTGTYELAVTLPGEAPPRLFAGLPLREAFERLEWLGIASLAQSRAVYYVDNLYLGPKEAAAP